MEATKRVFKLLNGRFEEVNGNVIETISAKILKQRSKLDYLVMIYKRLSQTLEELVALEAQLARSKQRHV